MGLERTAAVMQGVHSNYEIDLFVNLIEAAAEATNTRDLESKSLRVIADHIRASSFLIIDGVLPSNEGRGYVLRRIVRRALRHGYMLGQDQPFFYKLVAALDKEMGVAYPELKTQRPQVERVLKQEEERFAETLSQGMTLLDTASASSRTARSFRVKPSPPLDPSVFPSTSPRTSRASVGLRSITPVTKRRWKRSANKARRPASSVSICAPA